MAENGSDHALQIQAQYVKDLSFENPNAPAVYTALGQSQPEVSVSIDVASTPLAEHTYEVVLNLQVGANVGGKAAFLVDLQYAAVVNVHKDVPESEIEPLLLKETPRFIFPFARGTVADVTREGGFPPLVINPIDFDRFYEHKKRSQTQDAAAAGS